MRELSTTDIQRVSGGSDITDGAGLILTGVTLAKLAGIAGAGVVTAFIASPAVALFALGLVGTGGYVMGTAVPKITIGPDISAPADRQSDC